MYVAISGGDGPGSAPEESAPKALKAKKGNLRTQDPIIPYQAWDEVSKSVKDIENVPGIYTEVDSNSVPEWETGWYVVTKDTDIKNRITINGEVNLILCDGATLTAEKGITVATEIVESTESTGSTETKITTHTNVLNIYAQSTGRDMGSLVINNTGENAAGIGGVGNNAQAVKGGTVIIHGGNVIANGGEYAAGIGGGFYDYSYDCGGGEVTIYGGNVTATGGSEGAGIGGGKGDNGGAVNIFGGTVIASGGSEAEGIGGGKGSTYHGPLTLGEGVTLYGGESEKPTSELASGPKEYDGTRYRYMSTTCTPPRWRRSTAVTIGLSMRRWKSGTAAAKPSLCLRT